MTDRFDTWLKRVDQAQRSNPSLSRCGLWQNELTRAQSRGLIADTAPIEAGELDSIYADIVDAASAENRVATRADAISMLFDLSPGPMQGRTGQRTPKAFVEYPADAPPPIGLPETEQVARWIADTNGATGIFLVAGVRGAGKTQLLTDVEAHARNPSGTMPSLLIRVDIGMGRAATQAHKFSKDLLLEICERAKKHALRVVPMPALGSLVTGLGHLVRWTHVNLGYFGIITMAALVLIALHLSFQQPIDLGELRAMFWSNADIPYIRWPFRLAVELVAVTATAILFGATYDVWLGTHLRRGHKGRASLQLPLWAIRVGALAIGVALCVDVLVQFLQSRPVPDVLQPTPAPNGLGNSAAAFIGLAVACIGLALCAVAWRRCPAVRDELLRDVATTPPPYRGASATPPGRSYDVLDGVVALLVASAFGLLGLGLAGPPEAALSAIGAAIALGIAATSLLPRYWLGFHVARALEVRLAAETAERRVDFGFASVLAAMVPHGQSRTLHDSSADFLQNELKVIADQLARAFGRVIVLVDDVDILPSRDYNELMRILRPLIKADEAHQRIVALVAVPTIFWHAYKGPELNDIHSTVKDVWLLGDPALWETRGKETPYQADSEICVRENVFASSPWTWHESVVNRLRALMRARAVFPVDWSTQASVIEDALTAIRATSPEDLRRCLEDLRPSMREWLRILRTHLRKSHLSWTRVPPPAVLTEPKDWRQWFATKLKDDYYRENMLDHVCVDNMGFGVAAKSA